MDTWVLVTSGGGYDRYYEYTWSDVPLRSDKSFHSLVVTFLDGKVNFCAVGARYSMDLIEIATDDDSDSISVPPTEHPTLPSDTLEPTTSPLETTERAF